MMTWELFLMISAVVAFASCVIGLWRSITKKIEAQAEWKNGVDSKCDNMAENNRRYHKRVDDLEADIKTINNTLIKAELKLGGMCDSCKLQQSNQQRLLDFKHKTEQQGGLTEADKEWIKMWVASLMKNQGI